MLGERGFLSCSQWTHSGLKVSLGPSRIQPSLGREHSKAGFITTSLHDPKDLPPSSFRLLDDVCVWRGVEDVDSLSCGSGMQSHSQQSPESGEIDVFLLWKAECLSAGQTPVGLLLDPPTLIRNLFTASTGEICSNT